MNTGSVCVVSYDLDWLLGDSTCLLSEVQTCVALCNGTGGELDMFWKQEYSLIGCEYLYLAQPPTLVRLW